MSFASRYASLNAAQKAAVDTIDGPVMVVAGPGTGKTELLSMRVANILDKTDTLPENILCLTFTESGAYAMRERLKSIIGKDAYRVAIHTFHSFGTETMNRYPEYFYNAAAVSPASDSIIYESLQAAFETLPHDSPIASTMNGEFVYLRDSLSAISELKRSGLTSDELLQVLRDNERVLDSIEPQLQKLFSSRITSAIAGELAEVAYASAAITQEVLPPGIQPLANVLAISISHAVDAANDTNSTKPLTAWRNEWLEKNEAGEFVFKDRKQIKKLRALSQVYNHYLTQLQNQSLYDFDDMVLNVVHALEVYDDFRFNLQEQYHYIMVDEFQDTNLAQARILYSLGNNPVNEGAPNLMVVGDDDQAIYSFQGAEVSNILQFRDRYESVSLITLTENYRSSELILKQARDIITLGEERLERYIPDLSKELHANFVPKSPSTKLYELASDSDERAWIAKSIVEKINSGVQPSDIAVIARRHHELISLLPYLQQHTIAVSYEKRSNVLEHAVVIQLESLLRVVHALTLDDHDTANALLPKLLSHPAWNVRANDLWRLSLDAHTNRKTWLEAMSDSSVFEPQFSWLIELSKQTHHLPLESLIDICIGSTVLEGVTFRSPFYTYFFDDAFLSDHSEKYIDALINLRTLRDHIREHLSVKAPSLDDLINYIDLQREMGTSIVATTKTSLNDDHAIQLLTAHKSKGLEFPHVYIIGAVDSAWGQKVRTRARLIRYPLNLPLSPAGEHYDERLRLFYVAMTRAKESLIITASKQSDTGKPLLTASFLATDSWQIDDVAASTTPAEEYAKQEAAWYIPLVPPKRALPELLAPVLEKYKLSATHLNNFLDVSRGGPQHFLIQNLLRFPEAMTPSAVYGSAIHKTLQQAHSHFRVHKHRKPVEDVLRDFEATLQKSSLNDKDMTHYLSRGVDYLQQFLTSQYESFTITQQPELSFSHQQSRIGEVQLTGSLDVVEIDTTEKSVIVTDYKTGKPSSTWQGKTDQEKIKLHKYRQQLLFYKLLVEQSREFHSYTVEKGIIQYIEPDASGAIRSLELRFDQEELARSTQLITAVWQRIMHCDFIDTSEYDRSYKGILAFEDWLLENS